MEKAMPTKQGNTMEDAVKAWREIEARRDALKEKFEEKDSVLKAAMQQLEVWMMRELKRQGLDAVTVNGVARVAVREKRRFGVADWDTFKQWCLANANLELFQLRLKDSNVQQYFEEHEALPPAVNASTELVIAVTKA